MPPGFRHARVDGRPNDPVHPELIGGEDWDDDHIPGAALLEVTGADDADLSVIADTEDGNANVEHTADASGTGGASANIRARAVGGGTATAQVDAESDGGQAYVNRSATAETFAYARTDATGQLGADARVLVGAPGGDAILSRTGSGSYVDAQTTAAASGTADVTATALSTGGQAFAGMFAGASLINMIGLIAQHDPGPPFNQLKEVGLPRTDPLVNHAIWVDNGVLRVSTGSPAGEIGFRWHWYFGPDGLVLASGGVWRSDLDLPTIDADVYAFLRGDNAGAVTPVTGAAGAYLVEFTVGFTSTVATGVLALQATGSTGNRPTSIFRSDSNPMVATWIAVVELEDDDNRIDLQVAENVSDHDITLRRVDVTARRLGPAIAI